MTYVYPAYYSSILKTLETSLIYDNRFSIIDSRSLKNSLVHLWTFSVGGDSAWCHWKNEDSINIVCSQHILQRSTAHILFKVIFWVCASEYFSRANELQRENYCSSLTHPYFQRPFLIRLCWRLIHPLMSSKVWARPKRIKYYFSKCKCKDARLSGIGTLWMTLTNL